MHVKLSFHSKQHPFLSFPFLFLTSTGGSDTALTLKFSCWAFLLKQQRTDGPSPASRSSLGRVPLLPDDLSCFSLAFAPSLHLTGSNPVNWNTDCLKWSNGSQLRSGIFSRYESLAPAVINVRTRRTIHPISRVLFS